MEEPRITYGERTPLYHTETGSPFPYWLDFGVIRTTEGREIVDEIKQVVETMENVPPFGHKMFHGRLVVMFRSIEDRMLAELIVSNRNYYHRDLLTDENA